MTIIIFFDQQWLLRILSSPDYETKSEYALRFRSADQHVSEHRMVLGS